MGATSELKIDTIRVEDMMKGCLYKSGVKWMFNVPDSSHMDGRWERMIGVMRRVLDSVLQESVKRKYLSSVLP